ncbi:MAG: hypothetical protein HN548_04745, partial [Opitutae bacterium]|nr:hypothetical protein [Opitutae bacterium]
DSNEGRIFLITDNNATRLTLDLSRLAPGESLQNLLQDDYSVEIMPANTLGSIFGTTANEIPLTGGVPNEADLVYLWNKTTQAYSTYFFLSPAVGSYLEGWYNKNSIGAGLMKDLVVYPNESLLIAKKSPGGSIFNTKINLGSHTQFTIPENSNQLIQNPITKTLGQLIPSNELGTNSSKFRTGIGDTDINSDKISILNGAVWSDFYYKSGVNDGVTTIATATARAGSAGGNGLAESDISLANGLIYDLQSCTASGGLSVDHNESNYTRVTLSGTAPLVGFDITLQGVFGNKLNDNGDKELDVNGIEVSNGSGVKIFSGLIGTHKIVARPTSSTVVVRKRRDVNFVSTGPRTWSTGQGGNGYNQNAKAYFLGGGSTSMAVATAIVSGGSIIGFDFSGTGNSRGAGYLHAPQVMISGGGWRKIGAANPNNVVQDEMTISPYKIVRNNPTGILSYISPKKQIHGELLSVIIGTTSISEFFGETSNQPPFDLNSTPPLTIAENKPIGSIVGYFHATDPDNNALLTYHLVSGSGDGNNSIFALDSNGTLKTAVPFDYETNATSYGIRVQVRDEHNATMEDNFSIILNNIIEDLDGDGIEDYYDSDDDGDGFSDAEEITYGSDPRDPNSLANTSPSDLNSTTLLTIAENKPVGTIVGYFNATDPDNNALLTYHLVSGSGDGNNSFFMLLTNGTLKSATTFDYEVNHSTYSIRVQAKDEYNASVERKFTVVLTNVIEDLDGDGMEDHYDSDDDDDGFSDLAEIAYGSNPRDSNSLANTPPVFEQNQSFSIAENEPPATLIGNISAYDPDNNQSIPVVMESPSSAFVYDMNQSVRSAQVFDFESNQTNYSLSFSAKDEFNSTTFHVIYIEVSNVIEDLDEDGFEDAFDSDIDGDELENENEIIAGTDPNNPDTDSDGLLDGEEIMLKTDPLNPDSDGDQLSDKTEMLIGTSPLHADTDKDGFSDKEEVIAFTSPEDANDFPGNSLRQSPNLGPDGKVYEVVKEPMSLEEAWALAQAKGATLPHLDPTQIELNKFLAGSLLRNQVETKNYVGKRAAWVTGNNNRVFHHPYFWIRYANIVLTENGLGLEPRSNRKLSVILVRELSQIQVPGILTLRPKVSHDSVLAIAKIMDDGGDPPFRIGFRISEKILVSNLDESARIISAKRDGIFFNAQINRLTPGKTYYIRAFAENAAGLQYGSVRRIKVENIYNAPFDGSSVGGNWYQSEWFGAFMHGYGNWIFHNQLGWLYHGPANGNGIWLWSEKTKWSWTRSDIWPYLWINDQANWLYFYESNSIQPTFWNFSDQSLFIW